MKPPRAGDDVDEPLTASTWSTAVGVLVAHLSRSGKGRQRCAAARLVTTAMDADAIVDELKRQVRELRAAGAEPKEIELGDVAYDTLRERAGAGFASINLLLDDDAPGAAWFGPGAPPEEQSAIVRWLPVSRAGADENARVIP